MHNTKVPTKSFFKNKLIDLSMCNVTPRWDPLSFPPLTDSWAAYGAGGRRRWRKNGVSYICVYAGVGGTGDAFVAWAKARRCIPYCAGEK